MRHSRLIHCLSLFAYLWVAVGVSQSALLAWLAADHHDASTVLGERGMRVVLHHHAHDEAASIAKAEAEGHGDHVLDLPIADDALANLLHQDQKFAKLWLGFAATFLVQTHVQFARDTLLAEQPPPTSRNRTLAFFRTILLLI